MSKVSVIIPIYGVEKYIERCARSLFEQTLDDIEFIFVDDCTKDQSICILEKVLSEYPQRQKQTTIVHHEMNKGLPLARQTGIMMATGDFIAHCDSDDWVDVDVYRQMYDTAINEKADVVICDYYKANDKIKETYRGCFDLSQKNLIKDLLEERISWSVWNKLVKSSLYKDSDIIYPKDNMGEDLALVMQLVLKAGKISCVSKPLYYYFYNAESISNVVTIEKRMRNFYQNKANTDIILSVFNRLGVSRQYSKGLFNLKWRAKRFLWNMPYDRNRRTLWIETYKEINKRVLFSSNISIENKIKFILAYIAFYPPKKN